MMLFIIFLPYYIILHFLSNDFCNIGTKLGGKIPVGENHFRKYLTNKTVNSFFRIPVFESDVKGKLLKLNPRKASSPDNYSPKCVRYIGAYYPMVFENNKSHTPP